MMPALNDSLRGRQTSVFGLLQLVAVAAQILMRRTFPIAPIHRASAEAV